MTRADPPRFVRASLTLCTLCALFALSCDEKDSERACALFSVEECTSRPYCAVVTARPLDEERRCQHASRPLACSALVELDCGTALTLARDGDGQLFWLASTCVPSGLREENDTALYSESSSWPACE